MDGSATIRNGRVSGLLCGTGTTAENQSQIPITPRFVIVNAENRTVDKVNNSGDFNVAGSLQLIVGQNGYLIPGSFDYIGFRDGAMRFGRIGENETNQGYTS